MVQVTITGKLADSSSITDFNGDKMQSILVNHQITEFTSAFYRICIYSQKSILQFWSEYNDNAPPLGLSVDCVLKGKMNKNNQNSLTLIYKNVLWIYS